MLTCAIYGSSFFFRENNDSEVSSCQIIINAYFVYNVAVSEIKVKLVF